MRKRRTRREFTAAVARVITDRQQISARAEAGESVRKLSAEYSMDRHWMAARLDEWGVARLPRLRKGVPNKAPYVR